MRLVPDRARIAEPVVGIGLHQLELALAESGGGQQERKNKELFHPVASTDSINQRQRCQIRQDCESESRQMDQVLGG
jgi:hypothetical protein